MGASSNLMVASKMLSFMGIKPLLAANGAEAVALASGSQPGDSRTITETSTRRMS